MSWSGTYAYSWNPPPPPRRITTSRTELIQIGIAYAVLTVDIALLFSGSSFVFSGSSGGFIRGFTPLLVTVAATAALTGFVAHEMAHKIAAQRRGFWAEFRVYPYGLFLSLIMAAAVGFLFAAPGATMVGGISEYDRPNWGRTALAGPLSNVAFAAVFYAGSVALYLAGSFLAGWLLLLAFINAWFGTFNLIPFGPLDGAKVFRWSRSVWCLAIAGTGFAAVVTFLGANIYGGNPFFGL